MTETSINTGRVKWFNNKAGYGFITWTNSSGSEDDIFVHHSALNTENDQFRYLVEGEYVTFSITDTGDKTTASSVTGPDGGKLMCETRRDRREQSDTPSKTRENTSTFRGGGPRSGGGERILVKMVDQEEGDGTVWELVRRGTGTGKRRNNRKNKQRDTNTESDETTNDA